MARGTPDQSPGSSESRSTNSRFLLTRIFEDVPREIDLVFGAGDSQSFETLRFRIDGIIGLWLYPSLHQEGMQDFAASAERRFEVEIEPPFFYAKRRSRQRLPAQFEIKTGMRDDVPSVSLTRTVELSPQERHTTSLTFKYETVPQKGSRGRTTYLPREIEYSEVQSTRSRKRGRQITIIRDPRTAEIREVEERNSITTIDTLASA